MTLATRWALVPAVLAGWLCLAAPAWAVVPEVRDEAGMFSADATKRANEIIADISRKYKKDLLIETYKTVPANKAAEREKLGDTNFFPRWAEGRFGALRTNGIGILICNEPKKLQIVLGEETQRKAFRPSDRDKLRQDLLANLKEEKFDRALLDAVQFVSDRLQTNVKTTTAAPARRTAAAEPAAAPAARQVDHHNGGSWVGTILMWVLIIGGIWLVIGLIRTFTGGWGGGGYGPGGGYYGGGGGFFTSLLGGMFGAAAGMWMYNNFFGGHSSTFTSSAYGSEGDGGSSASDEGRAGSTTSDDWGDSGGNTGSDWGSSDSGGGDWGGGGGDWGGGGGGGDW